MTKWECEDGIDEAKWEREMAKIPASERDRYRVWWTTIQDDATDDQIECDTDNVTDHHYAEFDHLHDAKRHARRMSIVSNTRWAEVARVWEAEFGQDADVICYYNGGSES